MLSYSRFNFSCFCSIFYYNISRRFWVCAFFGADESLSCADDMLWWLTSRDTCCVTGLLGILTTSF